MKENKKGSRVTIAPAVLWCICFLLLSGCSGTEEGTWKQESVWKQEYENCMAAMEQGISEHRVSGEPELSDYEGKARNWSVELWQESLEAFSICVQRCIENQSESMGGEEDIYRNAVLLMTAVCESRGGAYEFAFVQEEDPQKAQEDFQAVIGRENPIDESIASFQEDFDIYYYGDILIAEKLEQAWQEEFYHCLDLVRDRVRRSDAADREQILEALEAWEDFFEIWAEVEWKYRRVEFRCEIMINTEEILEWLRTGGELSIWQGESRAEVFRTGTLLLIDGLERSGGSYEFLYDGETDRQALTHRYRETETVTREERGNHYMGSVDVNVGFSARQGTVIVPGEEGPVEDVPEDLLLELLAALQNDTLEDFLAGVSAEYTLLREEEAMEYMRKEASGILESCYYDYMEEGGEWFLFGRDNGIIVRQKTGYEKYPYCYYMFPCEGKLYGPAIRVYGKNEDYWFIGWEDNDYLVVTRREEGQVEGIAVYLRYRATQSQWQSNRRPEGWAVGLDKTHDGEIRMTFYPYHNEGSYFWGRFLNY